MKTIRLPAALGCAAAISLALFVAACGVPPDAPAPSARPVKVETVGQDATRSSQSFVGTLRARQRAELGFESGGRLAAVLVDVGDHVRAGQLLAQLEGAPAQWRLDKAEADRSAAAAALTERASQLRQHEALAKDQIISVTALESVRAQHQLALSQLQSAEAGLALARRDLALSRITAPFDGDIVARSAQPRADLAPGQSVLQIEAPGALEVVAMLPDVVASRLVPGQGAAARASLPDGGGRSVPLTLERLSSRSESGSLVQAVFKVGTGAGAWRSGGVVSLDLPSTAPSALSVPAQAVLPEAEGGKGSVFVLDTGKGRVERRAVQLGGTVLPNGRVAVTSGLVAGEAVVVAGAAFLTNGQAVVRYVPQTLLSEAH